MAQKMVKEITDEDATIAFRMIDNNKSETISFEEMTNHFKKVNKL